MFRFLFISFGFLFLLSGCTGNETQPAQTEKMQVSASFYPLAFLAESIGGENVEVNTLIPAGAEPHDYEPTPKEIAGIYKSKVFIYHGAGIDPWAQKILPDLQEKGVNALAVTQGLAMLKSDEEQGFDPHVWLDINLFMQMADAVKNAFITADPAHAQNYTARAQALQQKLSQLDEDFTKTLNESCRLRSLIVNHNAFAYLGHRYTIEMIPITGIMPESEPSPAQLGALVRLAKEKGIHTIMFETLVSSKVAETLAKEVFAQTLVLNPLEGLTPKEQDAGEDFISIMQKNLTNIAFALECK